MAGIGLRLPHLMEVAATRPPLELLEIHPENFVANPHATELLLEARCRYPVSIHTVGVSVGSADGLDLEHLRRVRALVESVDPALVSGHLAWSTVGGAYLNDLLPLPFTQEALGVVVRHLEQVQDALGREFLIENPSSYVAFSTSTMTESEFLNELVARTGCRLLCDVSNVYLSAHNMGYDAHAFIDALPADAVGELHLGGFTPETDPAAEDAELLVDTHAAPIAEAVWELYAHAVRRFGPQPTIVEWDNDLPPLATLLEQAARAGAVRARAGDMHGASAR